MMPVKFIKTDGAGIGDWRRFHVLLLAVSAQVLTWTPHWNFAFLVMLVLYILVEYSEEIVCRSYIQGVMK